MVDQNKEYKLDRKKQRNYLIIIILLAIPLLIYSINGIVKINKEIASYKTDNQHLVVESGDTEGFIRMIKYDYAVKEKSNYYYILVIYFLVVLFALHSKSFTDIKLLINKEEISLFSIFQKEPTDVFYWDDIKSFQFGKMHSDHSRFKEYIMKITYLEKKYNEESYAYHKISIKRFQDYKELIENIEEMGLLKNIEVFHMND